MLIVWIVLVFLGISFVYLSFRLPHFFTTLSNWSRTKNFLFGCILTFCWILLTTFFFNFVNAIVCTLYLCLILVSCDFLFWLVRRAFYLKFSHDYSGGTALILTILTLTLGWYFNHAVWQTNYFLTTSKQVPSLKIAMITDAHLGTTFDAKGFEKHLQMIQKQNPDMLVVIGDYVDDATTKEQMINSTRALGKIKTKYGIYFVFGNHDKGYYKSSYRGFSSKELVAELTKNNVIVLRDETVLLDNAFYLIGRRDASERTGQGTPRKTMSELTSNLDKSKYMIVLDHQPTDYQKQSESGVDLVLSGHTHGGQLFPFNQVGKWIRANDFIYGYTRWNQTDFIVSSGISAWSIQFKTGTKSEFVLITIK